MSYTAAQWVAIGWWLKREKLKPALSAYPLIRGTASDGSVKEESIGTLVEWHKNTKAQEKRARAGVAKDAREAKQATR